MSGRIPTALLEEVMATAETAWPGLDLCREKFGAFVAERIPPEEPAARAVAQLKTSDLYLVCACLEGCPRAIRTFERHYLADLDAVLGRIDDGAVLDQVKHLLYGELLVGAEGKAPKLSRYAGRGDLKKWLRVTAIRRAQDVLRKEARETSDEATLMNAVAAQEDQELAYMKRVYRSEFKTAFEAALASLTTRERNILRHQLLDGLAAEQIGALYKVHRITVVRWNGKIRQKLLNRTRREMMTRLSIAPAEVRSITRLIQSQFDVSLRRCLKTAS